MDHIRKQDAREKILLGGLVVKAGLRNAEKEFILGCLIKAAHIDPDSVEYKKIVELGKISFSQ